MSSKFNHFLVFLYEGAIVLRSMFLMVALFVTAILFSVSYLILLLVIPKVFLWRYWVRPWAWLCLLVAGQRVRVIGDCPPVENGPYLFVANHESFFDAFLMGYVLKNRVTGLGAKEYFRLPIWGQMMWLHGVISVDRKNHNKAIESIGKAEQAVLRGESIVVFPEQHRSLDGRIQDFRLGAFYLANNTKVTIVPCSIFGSYFAWSRDSFLIFPGTLTFRFLSPIPYEEYVKEYDGTGPLGIATLVKSKIVDGIDSICAEDI